MKENGFESNEATNVAFVGTSLSSPKRGCVLH